MADRLQADLAALSELASDLATVRDRMEAAKNPLFGDSWSVGSAAIGAKLEEFARTWDVGRTRIVESANALEGMLTESVAVYAETDEQIAAAFDVQDTGGGRRAQAV